jgi:predicted AlkP superfamily phosphohydrolase/phosphomutase
MKMNRREFLAAAAGGALQPVPLLAAGKASTGPHRKVIVIGIDGMDPQLSERMMDAGELPNFDRMRKKGWFSPLGTSIPPQSPVAWANFITGAGPGVHGIFDFVHRDPQTYFPYYSAAQTLGGDEGWDVGDWKIPLTFWPFNHSPTETKLCRKGTAFWSYLDEAGISARIYDIPSNYPPTPSDEGNVRCLSGMGVPDLLGSYGTHHLFAQGGEARVEAAGSIRKRIEFDRHGKATASLEGPENTALKEPKRSEIEFSIYRHPTRAEARIDIQDHVILLKEHEWSGWQEVSFTMEMPPFLPDSKVTGIVRFYLQEVRPYFRLYASPININPADPGEQRISEPASYVTKISEKLGLFGTEGFQEDYNALKQKVFNDAEYKIQADFVLKERFNLLNYALGTYDDGFLFFYFSSTDLQSHMFWWDTDDKHPVRTPEDAKRYNNVISDLYKRMDKMMGDILDRYGGEALVFAISDHGFGNFGRQFELNTWLRDNGFINPPHCRSLIDPSVGRDHMVDWSRTTAYGLGLNGLYLNRVGRERNGIVTQSQADELLERLREGLLEISDPVTGERPIANVYRTDQDYHGPEAKHAPDLIIGYARGYRSSWATGLGSIVDGDIITDNDSAWSADHCMAAEQLPGVIFCNQPLKVSDPALIDLAPTILQAYGLPVPKDMTGRVLV